MKSYTDLEQSKKLAEILPIESADMYYSRDETTYAKTLTKYEITYANVLYGSCDIRYFNICEHTPCWSLAALMDLLPNNEHIETNVSRGGWKIDTFEYVPNTWWCEYEDNKNQTKFSISADNPIDACVDMIIKLNEQKLL